MFSPAVVISPDCEVALMNSNLRLLCRVLGYNSDTVMDWSDNVNPNRFTWLIGLSVVAENAHFDIDIARDDMYNDGGEL